MTLKLKRFKLFASCIIVNGYKESLIYDLERYTNYSLPNEYISIIKELNSTDIDLFIKKNNFKPDEIISFTRKFINEEIAFFTDEPDSFPDIDLTWKSPHKITNAVIQIDENTSYNVLNAVNQLCEIGCQAVQLRVEFILNDKEIIEFLSYFDNTRIKSIDLIIPFNPSISKSFFFKLIEQHPRIRRINIYNANNNKIVTDEDLLYDYKIFYSVKDIREDAKEIIDKKNFFYNISVFSESQKHNVGLNRKVSICSDGSINNYIGHKKMYGDISSDKIIDIISQREFKSKWYISNDQIEKCKDCQFRYSCISNSDIKINNKLFYKTELCKFNPYTNIWKE